MKQKPEEMTVIGLKIPKSKRDEYKQICKQNASTISQTTRLLVDNFISEQAKKTNQA